MYSSLAFQRAIACLCMKYDHRKFTTRCLLEEHRFPCRPVTSLQPEVRVIQMQKKFFKIRFGMYSSLAFERAIARLCTSNRTLNVTKHSFVVYTHFPHRQQ